MVEQQNFGAAIEAVKAGRRISRVGWNGKGMFVWLNKGNIPEDHPIGEMAGYIGGVDAELFETGDNGTTVRMPNLNMKAADGSTVTGWLASQTDILANDWCIHEEA
jgi:hypothetical protein